MNFWVPDFISKSVFYPLWDWRDGSAKLEEMRRLEQRQFEAPEIRRGRQWRRAKAAAEAAYADCAFYRRRGKLNLKSRADWCRIPLLSKSEVREHKDALCSDEYSKEELITSKTGGSTGVSLQLHFDQRCEDFRNAMALMCNRWSGWDLGRPVGALWGNPPLPKNMKERARNQLLDRLIFLDTVQLTPESMAKFADALKADRIEFLFGHAHSLFIFAGFVEGRKLPLRMKGIVSTSMMLLPGERAVIERAFGCKVTDRYGCEEVGLIACECERHAGLHVNMDHILLEVLKSDGAPAGPGEEGELVVTDLINRGMPLIRYQVGDVARVSERACSCGRTSPLLDKIVGRTADFLVRKDGALVAGVSLVERTLTAIAGLEQLQIVQESRDEIRLNVVPDARYTPETEKALLDELRAALGSEILYTLNRVSRLEQERNGKYRFAICKVAYGGAA